MNFESLTQAGNYFATLTLEPQINEALEAIGKAVEETAKSEFGVYQPQTGPFNQWAELTDYTKQDRLDKGYTENDPLLRSGKLRASISHVVDTIPSAALRRTAGGEVVIGSEDPVMAYQELGTANMPPRPVLGPAAYRNLQLIQDLAGIALVRGILPPGVGPAVNKQYQLK